MSKKIRNINNDEIVVFLKEDLFKTFNEKEAK